MEITVELDEDVESAIRDVMKRESDKSFELVVNELLRAGLADTSQDAGKPDALGAEP